MAVTTDWAGPITVRGVTYNSLPASFKAASADKGAYTSEGQPQNGLSLTVGTTYYVKGKASGDSVTFPYAVANGASLATRAWFTAAVFPRAKYTITYNGNGYSLSDTATKEWGVKLALRSFWSNRNCASFSPYCIESCSSTTYINCSTWLISCRGCSRTCIPT